ncbi:unnamed protein product [Soboliphyme baturini]|uniref:Fork-head domain-containing protein n=1 Tax=Soboliphyme baturini TaxID=241478 RepID=A0A183ISH5_9BILA|nr:unnamed protein product [Soboliphyme baturini]
MYPYFHSVLAQSCATNIGYHQPQQQLMSLERLPFGAQGPALTTPSGMNFAISAYPTLDPITAATVKAFGFGVFDPRNSRFVQEEPKPQHSYIGLIAMAILSSEEKKMVLCDIYQWILDHYSYFRSRGPGWRNSIRHNLSLNDCFIKAGRSANGKGHYWAIHPANIEDFKKGDFRRRRAQRKVRRHMGLTGGDDGEDSDGSITPDPLTHEEPSTKCKDSLEESKDCKASCSPKAPSCLDQKTRNSPVLIKKRKFDVESLLAPDEGRKSPQNSAIDFATLSPTLANFNMDMNTQTPIGISLSSLATVADLQQSLLSAPLPMGNVLNHPESLETWIRTNGVWVSSQNDGQTATRSQTIFSPLSAEKWHQSFAKIMARSYHAKDLFNRVEFPGTNSGFSSVKPTDQRHDSQ